MLYNETASASLSTSVVKQHMYVSCVFQGGRSRESIAVCNTHCSYVVFLDYHMRLNRVKPPQRDVVQNHTIRFLLVHISLNTTLTTLCLSGVDHISCSVNGVLCGNHFYTMSCFQFLFNCQLLIEWHGTKLWEWILIKLLNSFVHISHTD